MKKTLLLSALFIALILSIKPQKADAQITGISMAAVDSYYTMSCVLPYTDWFMISGTLTGTVASSGDTTSIYMNFDDGFDTTFKVPNYSYGGSGGGYFNASCSHIYTMPGTYVRYAIATSLLSGVTGTLTEPTAAYSDDCATLTGKLYVDLNGNCLPDAGEPGISYTPLLVVNSAGDTTFGGWTNDTGYYAIGLPPGSYTIVANPSTIYDWWYWGAYVYSSLSPSCPSSGTFSLTATSSSTYTENFAFNCAPLDTFDVAAEGWAGCMTPGDTTYIQVFVGDWWWYYGFNCTTLSSTVTLTLDSRLTYVSTTWGLAPTSVSGSTITWDYTSSGLFFGFVSNVKVVLSSSATIGDTICSSLYASPTSLPDPNLANNSASLCRIVTSSFDPNGKAVSPEGVGPQGYISNGTPLSYNIHFQNTGTAAAANITIVDTLSPNLDVKSLHILNSSAPVQIYTDGNLVKFRFNNINLPDKTDNPDGSIGSVDYAIMPKPGLAPNTQIWNKAGIYFDYNPAVITNNVLNTIWGTPLNVQHLTGTTMNATIYPNPATDKVYAKTDDNSDFKVSMTDMLGRTVASAASTNGNAVMNTQNLPAGLYIVKLINKAGKELTTKITIDRQ